MDDVKNQLVKDVAELKQQVAELGAQLNLKSSLTEERVREIVKEKLDTAIPLLEIAIPPLDTVVPPLETTAPPLEISKKRPFGLSSRGNKS